MEVLEAVVRPWAQKADTHVQLVPIIRKAVRVFVLIILGLFIAQSIFHWEIGPLLAGMGLGGLALALAAMKPSASAEAPVRGSCPWPPAWVSCGPTRKRCDSGSGTRSTPRRP